MGELPVAREQGRRHTGSASDGARGGSGIVDAGAVEVLEGVGRGRHVLGGGVEVFRRRVLGAERVRRGLRRDYEGISMLQFRLEGLRGVVC